MLMLNMLMLRHALYGGVCVCVVPCRVENGESCLTKISQINIGQAVPENTGGSNSMIVQSPRKVLMELKHVPPYLVDFC